MTALDRAFCVFFAVVVCFALGWACRSLQEIATATNNVAVEINHLTEAVRDANPRDTSVTYPLGGVGPHVTFEPDTLYVMMRDSSAIARAKYLRVGVPHATP